jgi:hypothetical protein
MSFSSQLFLSARSSAGPSNPQTQVQQNTRGDLLMAQSLPERTDLVRLGGSYHASIPTGSAFTTVAAWPTTRAELVLSNIALAGGKSLVIDRIWAAAIVTEAAASAFTIVCQISPAGLVAVAANNAAVLQRNLNGKGGANVSANASLALANTSFGIASQWDVPDQFQIATLAAVGVGQMSVAKINGGYVVQPQATFLMNLVLGTAVASAGMIGVVWHEANLDVG